MSPYLDLMKMLLQSGRPAYLVRDYINNDSEFMEKFLYRRRKQNAVKQT